ncbi:MAG: hypothetical protein WAV38_04125 [Xanthobacteraceae bacterium]
MFRKTLFTLVSVAALGFGSAAMAAHGGGRGGGGGGGGGGFGGAASFGGGGGGGSFGRGGSFGGAGIAAAPRGAAGPMMMHGGNLGPMRGRPMATAPMTGGRVQGWGGRTAWGHDHDHFHHRFHNRNFFAFGFGGPIYDYAYDSCWTQVQTYYGWQWVNVCGDYGY